MAESTDRGSGWSLQASAVPDGVRLELALADLVAILSNPRLRRS